MPADFVVKAVVGTDDWANDYGQYTGYELQLEGPGVPDSTVVLNRKKQNGAVPQDKVPAPGAVLYGLVEQTAHGFKFKTMQKDDAGPSQGASNGSSQGKPDEAYWEARNASIVRQHSQHMAITFLAMRRQNGMQPGATITDEVELNYVRRLADWFDKDVERAANPLQQVTPEEPTPQPVQTDEDIPF